MRTKHSLDPNTLPRWRQELWGCGYWCLIEISTHKLTFILNYQNYQVILLQLRNILEFYDCYFFHFDNTRARVYVRFLKCVI
jgi:hypothetical protein